MKLLTLSTLWTVSLLILSGCGGATPLPKEHVVIDSTLPVITLTNNGTIVDMKTIAFEWKGVNDPRVKGVYVYKKTPNKELNGKLEYYDTISNRFKTHYVDSNVEPDTKYSYMFKTFSQNAQGVKSRIIVLNTLPVLQSVSWIHSITGMPRAAKIIWRPHVNEKVKSYVIQRKTLQDSQWNDIVTINGRLNAEYIDEGLKDNYIYSYRMRVVTYDDIVSSPSQIVKVVTKALPDSVKNIKTTKSLPRSVKINWEVSKQKDFSLYNLYRADKLNGSYDLIATLHNNTFLDKIEEDGKTYFYRVSVVDKDGLESESEKTSIAGVTLTKPMAPAIIQAQLIDSHIELQWKSTDTRSKSYVVTKKQKQGWFNEIVKDFTGVIGTKFVDVAIEPDTEYSYVVYSLDKNSIKSKASVEVKIVTPESSEIQKAKIQKPKKELTPKHIENKPQDVILKTQDLDLSGL